MSVHRAGLVNPNWPLCTEAMARSQGWTTAEIEDGELVDDPLISRVVGGFDGSTSSDDVWWFVDRPVGCRECLELAHA
jgi:hypothetical protein